jgi:hypothetical protein
MATSANVTSGPQAWLPIGQRVTLPAAGIYLPYSFDDNGDRVAYRRGVIVEHLGANGGVAVKFDEYPNVVDYTGREAHQFSVAF